MSINVFSETKQLKKVMLHRPGKELMKLTPEILESLLFDEIPDYKKAQEEHDQFAQIFRDNGVEVVYLKDLVIETLKQGDHVRESFLDTFLLEADLDPDYMDLIRDYLNDMDIERLVQTSMEGITKYELLEEGFDVEAYDRDFFIYPMPNLYFTRDSFATIGNSVSVNHMYSITRNRETLYGDMIFTYHPDYKDVKDIFGRKNVPSIEGGDILIISDELVLIGDSQRSKQAAIYTLAKNILTEESSFKYVLQVRIDDSRAFMHLDTVMTQLDETSFAIHAPILDNIKVNELSLVDGKISSKKLDDDFDKILSKYMNKDKITFFKCGGDDLIAAKREQWTDGANFVTISPGKVIAYKRNFVTNEILKNTGFDVLELDASNLIMGRGGPRCMSMPLERE